MLGKRNEVASLFLPHLERSSVRCTVLAAVDLLKPHVGDEGVEHKADYVLEFVYRQRLTMDQLQKLLLVALGQSRHVTRRRRSQ